MGEKSKAELLQYGRHSNQNSSRRGAPFHGPSPSLLDGSLGKKASGPTLDPLRLSDCDARSLRVHPGSDVHGGQLLEEQLGRVRDVHLRNLGFVLARPAFERGLLEVPVANQHLRIDVRGGRGGGLTPLGSLARRYRRCAL